jgi:hypothetical protein
MLSLNISKYSTVFPLARTGLVAKIGQELIFRSRYSTSRLFSFSRNQRITYQSRFSVFLFLLFLTTSMQAEWFAISKTNLVFCSEFLVTNLAFFVVSFFGFLAISIQRESFAISNINLVFLS